jgi:hypothetical protein
MPKPVYILCCESSSEDKQTGLLSHFNVFEKFVLQKISREQLPANPPFLMQLQARIFAIWLGEREDEGQEYEFETRIKLPPSGKILDIHAGKFKFARGLQRLFANIMGPLPVEGAGIMWIQNRIRRVGADEWLTQEFPIVFEEAPELQPASFVVPA